MKDKNRKMDNLFREYYKSKRLSDKQDANIDFCADMDAVSYKHIVCEETGVPLEKKAQCPSTSVLGAYIEGTLDEKEKAKITDHIHRCPDCKDKAKTGLESIQDYKKGELDKAPDYIAFDKNKIPPKNKNNL